MYGGIFDDNFIINALPCLQAKSFESRGQ